MSLPRHKQESFIRWMHDNKSRKADWRRNYDRIKKYGEKATTAFMEAVKAQHGKCAICHKVLNLHPVSHDPAAACLDHIHETGEFRGVLCRQCNRGIAFLDSVEKLKSAIDYLWSDAKWKT